MSADEWTSYSSGLFHYRTMSDEWFSNPGVAEVTVPVDPFTRTCPGAYFAGHFRDSIADSGLAISQHAAREPVYSDVLEPGKT
jgi:hypothetical protein